MLDRLKSLPLTIALTILIWMYAEAEFTSTRDGVNISVQIQSPDSNLWTVRAMDPVDKAPRRTMSLRLTVQGTKAQVDRIYQQSIGAARDRDAGLADLTITPTAAELRDGAEVIKIIPRLNALGYFRDKGVTVVASSPEQVRLEVDEVVRLTKPVQFRPASVIADNVSISPPTVELTMPAKTLKAIGGDKAVTIIATPQQPISGQAGSDLTVAVKFEAEYTGVPDSRIAVTPQTGTLKLQLKALNESRVSIQNVPIFVSGPTELLSKHAVEIKPERIRTLDLAGAPDEAKRLQATIDKAGGNASDAGVRVFVDLSEADTSGQRVQRRVRVTLPDGIRLDSARPDTVEFRLIPKAVPTTAP